MLLADLVNTSEAVSGTRSKNQKVEMVAGLLSNLSAEEAAIGISFLAGRPRQNRLGVGYATVYRIEATPASEPTLELEDVDSTLDALATTSGPGSQKRRESLLTDLLSRATATEQDFLRGLILRNLRQGALEGIMVEAVAAATDAPVERLRRAAMVEGDLISTSSKLLAQGEAALEDPALSLFTPVQPMLAKTAAEVGEAMGVTGTVYVDLKLDGARIQVHRLRDRVAVYTRNLRDVTDGLPEVVARARTFEAESFILDGEALLLSRGGAPMQFQDSMSRFGADGPDDTRPLTGFFFDCLRVGGRDLIDEPLRNRRAALEAVVPGGSLVESILTDDPEAAEAFFSESVAKGFEGVVVKDPEQPYKAGRRGSGWLKVKPTHTLDLVVLAAEWGSGRRQGWLSNLHLGAADGEGGFVMLGKTFKGLTDEMLGWQTSRFLEIEDRREGHIVYLIPEVVYEIAFDGVQRSSRYPGGVALRFARVKAYREDKTPEEADTIETVRSYLGP